MTKMLTFVERPRQFPDVSEAGSRIHDFHEIYADFDPATATAQASRCSQCGVPFCQIHCPLGNNIPDWLKLTAEGRMHEAYLASSATNTFPEICGRICPQDRLCEGNCVIEKGFDAVTIGSVEKHITETAFANGWVKPPLPARENGLSAGIIGAGPAGLAAADLLRRRGYTVHIYDRYDRAGGLMIYGIPNFKLEKSVVQRRIELLKAAGVQFHMNFEIGREATFEELRQRHAAVLIATGVYKDKEIDIPDVSLSGVFPAMDYLTASNKTGLGDAVAEFTDGSLNAYGKDVVVIGGGDTAMDCLRTAVRQGARSVTCMYRRDRANMPGSRREIKNAVEEGVEFIWLSAPRAFTGNRSIEKILGVQMRLGAADGSGRLAPVIIENSQFTLKADMVIKALGFDAEDITGAFDLPELMLSPAGTLNVDDAQMTSLPGVFAAGDIVRGASLVVWAIRDGREAALGMDRWVKAQPLKQPALSA